MYDDLSSETVFARYFTTLRRLAVRNGAGPEADDIAQEAIARFLAKRPVLDLDRDPFPWLVTVTNNLCWDLFHYRKRVCATDGDELTSLDNSVAASALDLTLARERSETVAEAIQRLAPPDREILYLRLVDEWSYRALSTHLGKSINTVRQNVHRARGRLMALIAQGRELAVLGVTRLRLAARAELPAQLAPALGTALAQAAVPLAMAAIVTGGPLVAAWEAVTHRGTTAAAAAAPLSTPLATWSDSAAARRASSSLPQPGGAPEQDQVQSTEIAQVGDHSLRYERGGSAEDPNSKGVYLKDGDGETVAGAGKKDDTDHDGDPGNETDPGACTWTMNKLRWILSRGCPSPLKEVLERI